MTKSLEFVLRLYAILFGLVLGLFGGLVLFSSLFRVLLDILFGYADSGPPWVTFIIIFFTFFFSFFCIKISSKWMSNYVDRKKKSKISPTV